MMFHPEPVLALGRVVGGIPRMAQAVPARRVRHFPLDVREDLSLLRLGCLFVLLVVKPASPPVRFPHLWRRCRVVSRPLQRVRRGDAVHDRCLIVSWKIRYHLPASGRRPIPAHNSLRVFRVPGNLMKRKETRIV